MIRTGAENAAAGPKPRNTLWLSYRPRKTRKPEKMKTNVAIGFKSEEIDQWSQHHLLLANTVVSYGLVCFNAIIDDGCAHEVHIVGSRPESAQHLSFHWVNTMAG
jgi:hypothetical protein